ncbi:MAG TPA: T9SS type A sorting domain-containing protein [Chitinophagales bacterium]|nr:T9SS type A sorting domain-containing protein [Chitinophagales bacterium]
MVQLAPNNKIYVSTWHGGTYALHVINNPDNYGLACNFQFNGQSCMSGNTNNLPNMVNYKLGALVGSGCDTLISSLPQNPQRGLKNIIQISPNPASDVVKITIADNPEQLQLVIYNSVGQVVKQTVISGYLLLDISDLPNGIYHIKAGEDAGKLNKAHFVVAR